jgi:hypothetical protein
MRHYLLNFEMRDAKCELWHVASVVLKSNHIVRLSLLAFIVTLLLIYDTVHDTTPNLRQTCSVYLLGHALVISLE